MINNRSKMAPSPDSIVAHIGLGAAGSDALETISTPRTTRRTPVVKDKRMDTTYDSFPTLLQHSSADEEEQQLLREIEESETATDKEMEDEPTPFDVLLGRGKSNTHHPGNKTFQDLVQLNRERYFSTNSAVVKRSIVAEIVSAMQEKGRFLKKEKGAWVEVDEEVSHQKVAHAIQYRRRRSLKAPDNSTSKSPSDEESEYSEPPKRAVRKKTARKLDASTAAPKAKRRNGQQANEAARSWLKQSATMTAVAEAVKPLASEVKPLASEVKPFASEVAPPLPLGADDTGVMDGFDYPSHILSTGSGGTDPLDCSGLHSLADMLNCMENQELFTLTNANHPVDTGGAALSLQQVMARQITSGRPFPTMMFSSSTFRSSSVGTFDPRTTEDGVDEHHPLHDAAAAPVMFHPDALEPHSMHSTIDPLDCSGLHSLADLLNSMENNQTLKQDLAATMAAASSIEHYLTSLSTAPDGTAPTTTPRHANWFDETSRSMAQFNAQTCVVPQSIYGAVAL